MSTPKKPTRRTKLPPVVASKITDAREALDRVPNGNTPEAAKLWLGVAIAALQDAEKALQTGGKRGAK